VEPTATTTRTPSTRQATTTAIVFEEESWRELRYRRRAAPGGAGRTAVGGLADSGAGAGTGGEGRGRHAVQNGVFSTTWALPRVNSSSRRLLPQVPQ
jgi:hypothetical protein